MENRIITWLFTPARWTLWMLWPGPRIWWHLFDDSKRSAVASVVVQSFGTFLTAVTARLLGADQYGQLAILSTCIGWFGIIASYPTLGLMARIMADGKASHQPYERRCATGLFLAMGFGLIAMLVGLCLLGIGLRYYGVRQLFWPGVLLCLTFPLATPSSFCVYLLQVSGRLTLWAILTLLFGFIPIGSLLVANLLKSPLTIADCITATFIATVINAMIGAAICVRLLSARNLQHPDFSLAGRMLHAGLGGFVATLACTFSNLSVATMIAKYVGSTALGHYQLVATISGWVYAVVISVSVPTLSRWAALAAQARLQAMVRSLRFRQSGTGALSIIAAILVLFFAPQILHFLYGPSFRSSATLLRLATPAWVALGFGAWYWIAFTAMGHPGRVMGSNIAWGMTQISLAWLLMAFTSLGIYGAMLAYVAAYCAWLFTYEAIFTNSIRAARYPDNLP